MSQAVGAVAASTITSVLATTFVSLHAVSRFAILKQSAVNDYLILCAVALSWSLTALIVTQARYGLGQHYDEVSPEDLVTILQLLWASILAYHLGLTVTKISALLRFLQFFVTRATRTAAWVLVTVVSTYGTAALIVAIYSCRPVAFFWNKTVTNGRCIDLLVFWYFAAAFNVVTDIAIVVLPLHVLKDLHLPRRQKWAVTGIFAVAGLTCVVAVLRLHSVYVIARSTDPTRDNVNVAMWSTIELNTAITCACMPSMKPLIQRIAPAWLLNDAPSRLTEGSVSRLMPTA